MTFAIHARTGGPETFDINAWADSSIVSVGGGLDHAARGLERLLYQFQGEAHPLIQALAEASLQPATVLDQLVIDVGALRWLDTAVGEQLDVLGAVVGIEREGRFDSPFRSAIEAQLLVLRSNGTVDEVLAPLDVVEASNNAEVIDLPLDPAGFRLSMTDPVIGDVKAERYRRMIEASRASSVRVWFYSWPAAGSKLFVFESDGGDPVADTDKGMGFGLMAREKIA